MAKPSQTGGRHSATVFVVPGQILVLAGSLSDFAHLHFRYALSFIHPLNDDEC